MKILRGLGLEEHIRGVGFAPEVGYNREWDTGEITYLHPMGAKIEQRFGAPDISLHRAALHSALVSINPPDDPPSRQEARGPRSHRRALSAGIRRRHAGRGRRGHRRRRRALDGARIPVRHRRAPLHRTGGLPRDLPHRIARHRDRRSGQMVGPGSPYRQLQGRSAPATSSISSPARPSRTSRSNHGRRPETWTRCGPRLPTFTRKRGSYSTPVRRFANGRWSSATPWRDGARTASS